MEDNIFIHSSFSQKLVKLKDKFKSLPPFFQLGIFIFVVLLLSLLISLPSYIGQEKPSPEEELVLTQPTTQPLIEVESVGPNQEELSVIDEIVQPESSSESILRLTGDRSFYRVGENIELVLRLESPVLVDGVEYLIFYEPEFLSQVKLETANHTGSFLSSELRTDTGEISGIWLRSPDEEDFDEGDFALIKISAVAQKRGILIFSFDTEQTKVAGLGGQSILKEAMGLTVEIR